MLTSNDSPDLVSSWRTDAPVSGPADIHSAEDAGQAAPGVVAAVQRAEADGFDGVIVDCTEDPGVVEAAKLVAIPVIGPGAALERAIAVAARPVVRVSGDELRLLSVDALTVRTAGAATVVLGGTGWSHIAEAMTADQPDLVVLDPLAVALDDCLVARHRHRPSQRALIRRPRMAWRHPTSARPDRRQVTTAQRVNCSRVGGVTVARAPAPPRPDEYPLIQMVGVE